MAEASYDARVMRKPVNVEHSTLPSLCVDIPPGLLDVSEGVEGCRRAIRDFGTCLGIVLTLLVALVGQRRVLRTLLDRILSCFTSIPFFASADFIPSSSLGKRNKSPLPPRSYRAVRPTR